VRVVLDVNVIISALLSADGAPARILREWQQGAFEIVVSPRLLAELERALGYPKLRRRIGADEAAAFVGWLGRAAAVVSDSHDPPSVRSPDPGDDYLIALAAAEGAMIVSGDDHLLRLAGKLPVSSQADFLQQLG
jgi:putative PIN family toxin of toxin-antitoxin system